MQVSQIIIRKEDYIRSKYMPLSRLSTRHHDPFSTRHWLIIEGLHNRSRNIITVEISRRVSYWQRVVLYDVKTKRVERTEKTNKTKIVTDALWISQTTLRCPAKFQVLPMVRNSEDWNLKVFWLQGWPSACSAPTMFPSRKSILEMVSSHAELPILIYYYYY